MSDSDGIEPPIYIHGPFVGMSDRYTGDEWKRVWDGFNLSEPMGSISCSECGNDVHTYAACRDDPGHNENSGQNYIMYDYKLAICAGCLYKAFPTLREVVDEGE